MDNDTMRDIKQEYIKKVLKPDMCNIALLDGNIFIVHPDHPPKLWNADKKEFIDVEINWDIGGSC